jgi:guanyl-specific ribonuclease Sa
VIEQSAHRPVCRPQSKIATSPCAGTSAGTACIAVLPVEPPPTLLTSHREGCTTSNVTSSKPTAPGVRQSSSKAQAQGRAHCTSLPAEISKTKPRRSRGGAMHATRPGRREGRRSCQGLVLLPKFPPPKPQRSG